MDRVREMEAFLEVAAAGSFAEAARRRRISPPSLTRLIAGLEDRLGTRLIQRTTRSLKLTEAGERFRLAAERVLDDLASAEREITGRGSEPRGRLVVTAPTIFGRLAVAPTLADFWAIHPQVSPALLLYDRVMNLIEEGIDVGVRIGDLPDTRLIARRVGAVRRILVASPAFLERHGHPHRPADLKTLPLLAFTNLMPTRGLSFDVGETTYVAPARQLEVNDAAAAIAMAITGHGFTIVASYMVRDAIGAGRLVEVLPAYAPLPIPVHIVFPESRLLAPTVRAFTDYAAPRLGQALVLRSTV